MDYSQFSNTDNLVQEFTLLIKRNEKLAIGYIDNLLGIFLSKKIDNIFEDSTNSKNFLFYAIKYGRENLVLKIVKTNLIDPKITNANGDNAVMYALTQEQYKIALELVNTGLFNLEHTNNKGKAAIDNIDFEDDIESDPDERDDVNNDPNRDVKIELLLKLMNYYIENNITTYASFQDNIEYICSEPGLITELNKELENNKSMNINIEKFKEILDLDNPTSLCANPVNTEAGTFVNDLKIVEDANIITKTKKKPKRAKMIKNKPPVIAVRDTERYIDENEYDSDEEMSFLLPPRKRLGAGKNKSRKSTKKSRKSKKN